MVETGARARLVFLDTVIGSALDETRAQKLSQERLREQIPRTDSEKAMNRVIAIPQGIAPGGEPWAVAGGGTAACTDEATVHVSPSLAGGYSRVQLCGTFIPLIETPVGSAIPAPIVCMSTVKGSVLGIVATGHTVSGPAAQFAYATAGDFDLCLVDPMSLEKIPFSAITGNIIISLQFQ